MRLWSIDPSYLDRVGLTALWREGLLAQKVLQNLTRGYRNHPQLLRFKRSPNPILYIGTYLYYVQREAAMRGYRFDLSKIKSYDIGVDKLPITVGQLIYEFNHLLTKLKTRSPDRYNELAGVKQINPHPVFTPIPGNVEEWERV